MTTEGESTLKFHKEHLLDELCTQGKSINFQKIRMLCRSNPQIISSTSLRLNIWSILLLGVPYDTISEDSIVNPFDGSKKEPCQEQHVLEADVSRTRADLEDFRSTLVRQMITSVLQDFCNKYSIEYKQGMNEILAPFIYLNPLEQSSTKRAFCMFEAFLFRYLERFFCVDDSSYLYKAFRLFHLLLIYHDPQLALHLEDLEWSPELYAPSWFLTLYSRQLPLDLVLRLWDMIITVDDPAFTFFIGLCLIRRTKSSLLLCEQDTIPEILNNMTFSSDTDIYEVLQEALSLYRITPRSFCRNLRLCCVGNAELAPQPVGLITSRHIRSSNDYLDKQMSLQTVRKCVMLTAQDLISSLLPLAPGDNIEGKDDFTDIRFQQSLQFVLIDVRGSEDSLRSGGGIIPKAITMEPEFLDHPDALDAWIQHFDGTKGCNICIIDLPPGQASSISLWRRLLLGEGDGFASSSGNLIQYGKKINANPSKLTVNYDIESKFYTEEKLAAEDDAARPASKLARALQRANFPNVSVLEGGFPSLVQQLLFLRGSVEPLVINHNHETWETFLKNSGRDAYSTQSANKPRGKVSTAEYSDNKEKQSLRSVQDCSDMEITEIAYLTAVRLGHHHMASVLEKKMKDLREIMNQS